MAFFKRPELEAQGITGNAQDWLMAELNRRLAVNYVSKDEAKTQADAAVQAALKDAPQAVDPTETDEYKALQQENNKLKLFGSEEFSAVNPKYKDVVYDKLEFGEGAAPIPEQLSSMRESMGELFVSGTTPAKPAEQAPRFGAPVTGSMPASGPKSTLENIWFGSNK